MKDTRPDALAGFGPLPLGAADPPVGSPGADGRPLPSWRDRDLALILLATLLLGLFVWVRMDGYALADSVEYLEHAQALARGERVLDSTEIRGIGFALVLAPPFLLAERLGLEDLRWIVPLARGLQLLFTLLLVLVSARLGARLAGREAGLAAAWIAGTCPVLLTFSVEPVSDVLATLLVAQALFTALAPGGARRGLILGAWMGAALLIAFKSLLVAAPLTLLVVLRDLRRRPRAVAGLALGLAIGVLVQVVLDRLRYGDWGRSLQLYLGSNGYLIAARILGELGFVETARRLYELGVEVHTGERYSAAGAVAGDVRQASPVHFYLFEATRFVALPGLALVALGALRTLARPRWARMLVLGVVAAAALVTAFKGSKDFRLWLPLLPAMAGLAALGFEALAGRPGERARAARLFLAVGLLLATGALSVFRLARQGSQRHAGYWAAMELVNADAAREGPGLRVSAAWHWALFLRESAGVELVKLPHFVEGWEAYDEAQRARDIEVLSGLDRFVTHLAVLTERPPLFAALNELFAVDALLFEPAQYRDLGPVLVLTRRRGERGDPGQRVLLDLLTGTDPSAYAARHGLGEPDDLLLRRPGGEPERLRLLGFDVQPVRGGHAWLTLHWLAVTALGEDLLLLERIETDPAGAVHEVLRPPAWGLWPTSAWSPGTIVREGQPLVAAARPFDSGSPWQPLGQGAAGTAVDAILLLGAFAPPGPERSAPLVLEPVLPGEDIPLSALGPPHSDRLDPRGRLRVGRFSLPRLAPGGSQALPRR